MPGLSLSVDSKGLIMLLREEGEGEEGRLEQEHCSWVWPDLPVCSCLAEMMSGWQDVITLGQSGSSGCKEVRNSVWQNFQNFRMSVCQNVRI